MLLGVNAVPSYSIVAVSVNDAETFQKYVDGHQGTLDKYNGRFLVASPDFEAIEGSWPGQIVVVHEWPDRDSFHRWYDSDEYAPWKKMRFSSATANVILVDGLPIDPV